jgi:glycosyltransferase involved in cell wall biosynthesis
MMTEFENRRIAFIPFKDSTNGYVARMQFLLSNFGKIEQAISVKETLIALLHGKLKRYDVIWVNFTENELLNNTGRISIFNLVKLFARTAIMVLQAKKSVFVRHNNYPHAAHPSRAVLLTKLVNAYERMFDIVVTHSGAEAKGKKMYCPHPLYTLVNDADGHNALPLKHPTEYFIVFGRILPYKKIELLAKNFPVSQTLLVAGAVGDKNYSNSLSAVKQDNFIFIPGYLTEIEAQKLVSGAKAMVISHSDADVVVSGTFFYAMTLGKPVFAVETEFFKWIKPRISPNLLVLAKNVKTLCRLIEDTMPNVDLIGDKESIQNEFGDETIIKALSNILAYANAT